MSDFPEIVPVRQVFPHPVVADLEGEVRRQIAGSRLREKVNPGARVAIAVGSRGIANIRRIAGAAVAAVRELGADPFLVAGMGTHGGGTSEGQRAILADFGIDESRMGCPVVTDMESTEIGTNEYGAAVYWDKNALAADHVVAINRVKAHTDFRGPIESGILKMIVIGLGKRESAKQVHRLGTRGMAEMVPASAKVVMAKTPFALGLAVIENAGEQTALVKAIEPEDLFEAEPKLLLQAKEWQGKLPFAAADILVVGELGKNYSGTGMDPNVLGRRMLETEDDFDAPRIVRIAVLDMSPESHGNSIGVGFADLTTERLVAAIDHHSVRLNTFTAQLLLRAKIPFAFPDDRAVFEAAFATCWRPRREEAKLAIIPNTLEVSELYVTAPLAQDLVAPGGKLEFGPPRKLPFGADGNLDQPALFPHAKQGRRAAGE
ncbi:MAG TPA: lactate racemase domain-containing protein [Planctomycetia bacterium]|nr:lactate racemase domain-containing protein [Planctomycetia bacterium]